MEPFELATVIISVIVTGGNTFGLLVMYRQYRKLAYSSMIFAADVIGNLYRMDENPNDAHWGAQAERKQSLSLKEGREQTRGVICIASKSD